MNKKQLLVPAITVLVAGGALLGASRAFAQDAASTSYPPIVQKIADKFGLKVEDVQTVFDEERATRQAEFKQRYEERLNTAVSEGKITEAQKQLIIQKHAEMETQMKANFEAFKDLSPEERREKMTAQHEELKKWAEDNGIDWQYVMPRMIKMIRHGGVAGEKVEKDVMMFEPAQAVKLEGNAEAMDVMMFEEKVELQ